MFLFLLLSLQERTKAFDMKSLPILFVLVSASLFLSCKRDPVGPKPVEIDYHFATIPEGQQLILANTEYYDKLTQHDLDWKARKAGATLDELKAIAQTCIQDFSKEEKAVIDEAVGYVEDKLAAMGALSLPFPDHDIVFIKTNMMEEGDAAAAYTHKTEIYLYERVMKREPDYVHRIIAHELFHCLTRNSPNFRRKMYELIGFHILDEDIDFAPNIRELILSNPDVEHLDNYATFTINGEKRDCALLTLYTATWEEAYAEAGEDVVFFDYSQTVLVPIEALDTWYPTEEASDFWDIVGKNTDYVDAPEECMATNFSFAVVDGTQKDYESPWLIEKIITLLKQ